MKLDEIDKKNIYKVPDRYFDTLPSRVQDRLPVGTDHEKTHVWRLAAAALVPACLLMLLFIYPGFLRQGAPHASPEELLARIDTEDVVAYLELTNITTDEILENIDPALIDMSIDSDNPLILQEMEIDNSDVDSILEHYSLDTEIYENI